MRKPERWEQVCGCASSASGPRVVIIARQSTTPLKNSAVKVTAKLARMACDRCNEPWKKVASVPKGEG